MKQGQGTRLFIHGLYFLLGISVLIRNFGNWSSEDMLLNLQIVLFGLVVVALLVSQIMEAIGLGKWAWVIFLLLLPVALANVIGLHLADYLGVLNVQDSNFVDSFGILEARDRPFIYPYLTLFVDMILLIITYHQRENIGMSDDLEDEPHKLSS